jgi:uncharacterized protein (DUF1330 family)
MSFYFMAGISVKDKDEYNRYLEQVDEVFDKYRGSYLAVDDFPQVLEGKWESERAVLIRFETKEAFEEWYRSEDYQEILKYRLKAADCNTILFEGKF